MRKGLLTFAVGAAMTIGAVSAEAMPAASIAGTGAAPQVVLVSGGCGIGFHRGPYGGCRPNGYFRPYGWGYGHPYWHRGWGWHGGWHRGWHRW